MLESEVERVAKITAADQGLDVQICGAMAYAVPGKIVLPLIETFDWLDARNGPRMLHGLVDHETAHAKWTDFDVKPFACEGNHRAVLHARYGIKFTAIEKRLTTAASRRLGDLYNVIEDARIEALQMQQYVGSAHNLGLKNEWALQQEPPVNEFERYCWFACYVTRGTNGFHAVEIDPVTTLRLKETEYLLRQAATSKSSFDALRIALDIYEALNIPEGDRKERSVCGPEDLISAMLIEEIGGNGVGNGNRPYVVFSNDNDIVLDLSHVQTREMISPAVVDAATSFAQVFDQALRAEVACRRVVGNDEGAPDPELLASYSLGAEPPETMFEALAYSEGLNTAVSILVDCSGSMRDRSLVAKQTAQAMCSALGTIGIPHEVLGYTTYSVGPNDFYTVHRNYYHQWFDAAGWDARQMQKHVSKIRQAMEESVKRTGLAPDWFATFRSIDSFEVPLYPVFKRFDSPDTGGLSMIQGLSGNLDGEAVLFAAKRLAKRPEPRRVLLVLNDGQPAGANHDADEQTFLRKAIKTVTEAGIETYGIGIQSNAVKSYYPKFCVVNDLRDLVQVSMSKLLELLLEGREEHACVTL